MNKVIKTSFFDINKFKILTKEQNWIPNLSTIDLNESSEFSKKCNKIDIQTQTGELQNYNLG